MFCEKCGKDKQECNCPEKIAEKNTGFAKRGDAKLIGVVNQDESDEKLKS